jgi:hypothetical protein
MSAPEGVRFQDLGMACLRSVHANVLSDEGAAGVEAAYGDRLKRGRRRAN